LYGGHVLLVASQILLGSSLLMKPLYCFTPIQKPGTTINEVCEIMMILKEINESLKLQNLRPETQFLSVIGSLLEIRIV
jgi:hypothetical protein